MPRTKAVIKKPSKKVDDNCDYNLTYLKIHLKQELETKLEDLEALQCRVLEEIKRKQKESRIAITPSIGNKTLAELKYANSESVLDTHYSSTLSVALSSTRSTVRNKTKRSASSVDEGYLTAEGSTGAAGGRRSRSATAVKKPKVSRTSRSLSRSNITKSSFRTPNTRGVLQQSYGTVTPKVKPNTPQVILRRPKQGEVALSLEGSPLLTASVVTDNFANVNIPLEDGRIITIQPQRGLRMSQIPPLDPAIQRQLEMLRDNLNKVCATNIAKK